MHRDIFSRGPNLPQLTCTQRLTTTILAMQLCRLCILSSSNVSPGSTAPHGTPAQSVHISSLIFCRHFGPFVIAKPLFDNDLQRLATASLALILLAILALARRPQCRRPGPLPNADCDQADRPHCGHNGSPCLEPGKLGKYCANSFTNRLSRGSASFLAHRFTVFG